MNRPRMIYFESEDVLHLAKTDEEEAGSLELTPDVTAEPNAQGELIGIEILRASVFLRDSVLDLFQARVAQMTAAKHA